MKMNIRRGVAAVITAAMVITSVPSTLVFAETTDVKWESSQDPNTGETIWNVIKVTTDDNGNVTYGEPERATEHVVSEGDCTKGEKKVVEWYDPYGISAEVKTESFIEHTPSSEGTIHKDVTCTTDGYDGYGTYCLKCEQPLSGRYTTIPATGHDVQTEEITDDDYYVAPTCDKDGRATVRTYCANGCDDYKETTEKKVLPKLGHKWNEGEITKEAGCEDGEKTYTCENCGETKKETIKGTGHKLATRKVYTKKPTCKETGLYHEETYCTVCGTITKKTADKVEENLAHDFGDEPTRIEKEATCTEEGKGIYTCSACGEEKEAAIPKKDHEAGKVVSANEVAPTCTKDGSHEELTYCKNCNTLMSHKTVTDKAIGHVEATKEENRKQADCLKPGSYDLVTYCTVCNEEIKRESKVIPKATKHTLTDEYGTWQDPKIENEVKPTCTKDGSHDEVVTCSVCKKELYRKTVTDKANEDGHDWQLSEEIKPATCTEEGEGYYQCSICGKKDPNARSIPETGHKWKETKVYKIGKEEPTCITDGYYHADRVCSVCDTEEIYAKVTIPQLVKDKKEHVEEDFEITYVKKEPTCTEEGVGITACKVCGVKGDDVKIPKIDHTWKTEATDNDFTDCTEDSTYTEKKTCTACGDVIESVKFVEGAKEHTYSADDVEFVFDKDDFTSGEALFKCTNSSQGKTCNNAHSVKFSVDKETAEIIPTKEATCTEEGRGYYEVKVTYAGVTATAKTADDAVIPKTDHKPAEAVKENVVLPTHSEEGSYDLVVYCENCKEELSREKVTVPATGHVAGEPVKENEVAATANTNASYDEVVYCSVCGEEMSRKKVVVEKKNTVIAVSDKKVTYNGKAVTSNKAKVVGSTGKVTYTYYSDSACKKKISAPTNAGTYYVKAVVASDVNYKSASDVAKITINKKAQSLSAKQNKSASFKTLKTKNVSVTFKKGIGKVTYSVVVLKAKNKKYVSVNTSTGKVTIKKGAVKGTYRVKVNYAGNTNYKATTTTVSVVVK